MRSETGLRAQFGRRTSLQEGFFDKLRRAANVPPASVLPPAGTGRSICWSHIGRNVDDAHGALLHAQLTAHALGLIDVGHIVLHGDGLLGAGLGALHAANAARGAGLPGQRTLVLVLTQVGQTAAQAPQPVHFSRSTLAMPSTMWMASKAQARVQSP